MTAWNSYGYPQEEGAHPDRPWWIVTQAMGTQRVRMSSPPQRAFQYIRSDGKKGPVFEARGDTIPDAIPGKTIAEIGHELAEIDAEHPLPAPPPRCGQVWAIDGDEALVTGVRRPGPLQGNGITITLGAVSQWYPNLDRWPPKGACLVAGPGAPWASMVQPAGVVTLVKESSETLPNGYVRHEAIYDVDPPVRTTPLTPTEVDALLGHGEYIAYLCPSSEIARKTPWLGECVVRGDDVATVTAKARDIALERGGTGVLTILLGLPSPTPDTSGEPR